jgi:hypothetical protein
MIMKTLISAVLAVSVLAGVAGQAAALSYHDNGGQGSSTLTWDPSGNRYGM